MGWNKEDLRLAPPPVTPIRPDLEVEGWGAGADASATGA